MWYLGHAPRTGGSNTQVVVVRNLFQPILDFALIQANTVAKGRLNNDKAHGKRNVTLKCAAPLQFMRTRRSETLIAMCVEEAEMNNKRVGGRLWGDVCRGWWDIFARMCVYALQTGWLSRGCRGFLRNAHGACAHDGTGVHGVPLAWGTCFST